MKNLLQVFYTRNKILTLAGLLNIFAFIVFVFLFFVDNRTILGINAWVKPMKFAVSIAAYVLTLALFTEYTRVSKRLVKALSVIVAVTMVGEMIFVALQASRGVTSHFNTSTGIDSAIFGIMGGLAGTNGIVIGLFLLLMFFPRKDINSVYLWSVRIGFLLLMFGNTQGGAMIANMAHTIGASDGGPGLPLTNWSSEGGDLRIAHLIGLHSFQIIPLFGYYISKYSPLKNESIKMTFLIIFSSGYFVLFVGTLIQALAGYPLIG